MTSLIIWEMQVIKDDDILVKIKHSRNLLVSVVEARRHETRLTYTLLYILDACLA